MKKIISKFLYGFKIYRFIVSYEPTYIMWSLLLIICNCTMPFINLFLPKRFIDQLILGDDYINIIHTGIIYGVLLLSNLLLKNYFSMKCNILSEKFTMNLKNDMGLTIMNLDFEQVEIASNRDNVLLAKNVTQITSALIYVQGIVTNVITVLGLTYVILRLDWTFILLVVITLVIKACFVRIQFKYRQKQRIKFAQIDKVGNYLTDVSYYNQGAAKEIRVNNAKAWLMKKIINWRREMVGLQYKDYGLYTFLQILSILVSTIQSFTILWILANRYTDGIINVAEFTMYFNAVTTLTISISSITTQIGEYNQQVLNLSDFNKLTKLKSIEHSKNGLEDKGFNNYFADINNIATFELEFHNVSFTYPKSEQPVLNNINMKIKDGEKLVVVGKNGAGKTTFIKLICKFYRPTNGKITLNNIDIWDIPNKEYYKIIAAVFQDYMNFSFSIQENIVLNKPMNDEHFKLVSQQAGIHQFVDKLDDGKYTYLTKLFQENGIELSGGEAQKLSIARALYKNSALLILDEPTASLDARAESEIYSYLFRNAKEKTTIFISHRLAASLQADNIAVFSEGTIVEYGSHYELIKLNGLYSEMFKKQSEQYITG